MSPHVLDQSQVLRDKLLTNPVIRTRHGTMLCTSLRPGHWLVPGSNAEMVPICVVLQNSPKLRRVEVYQPLGRCSESFGYHELEGSVMFGAGKRRIWWPLLPKWLQRKICQYGKPSYRK